MSERDLFEAALELPPENRGAYLDGVCGNDAALRERLQKCIATRVFASWEWPRARAFLARMEKDPAWPRWIPQKR
jgi:hypothetical protein